MLAPVSELVVFPIVQLSLTDGNNNWCNKEKVKKKELEKKENNNSHSKMIQ